MMHAFHDGIDVFFFEKGLEKFFILDESGGADIFDGGVGVLLGE